MASGRPRSIVIGIGNPDRGDDMAGREVARRLRGTLPPGIAVVEQDGEPATLIAALGGATAAFIVDACASGMPPGTLHRFDLGAGPLPRRAACGLSSHGLGLADAIELARALGQLPARCIVYAIEGQGFEIGAPLSPPVAQAVGDAVSRLRAELSEKEAGCTKAR